MEEADRFLKAAALGQARAALVKGVRERPEDQAARMFLFQLLAVLGEWDKAETQLRALAQLSGEAQMLATVYGQLIAAERRRADAFAGKAPFAVLGEAAPWLAGLVVALEHYAHGRVAEGDAERATAFETAPVLAGAFNDQAFDSIADCDSRFGPALEVVVAGNWGLIGLDAVERITSEGPKDLRDLVWLPAEIALRSGQSVAGFLPVRYPGTENSQDDSLRLARGTDWRDGASGEVGIGQRIWFMNDGSEAAILSLRSLRMA